MSGLKFPLILLLVVSIAFVVVMVRGSRKNNSEKLSGDNKSDADKFSPEKYDVIGSLGSVLGPFSPKLEVKQLKPSLATYTLQPQTTYTLKIAADPKNKFRTAKFRMPTSSEKRCAHLIYTSAQDPPEEMSSLKDQDSEKVGDADKPKAEIAFTILSAGGTITLARDLGFAGPCVVRLEQ